MHERNYISGEYIFTREIPELGCILLEKVQLKIKDV